MKKIKILLGLTIFFSVIIIFHFFMQIIYFDLFEKIHSENPSFSKSGWFIQNAFSFIILIGSIYISIALFKILKNGYFNIKTAQSFKIGGLLFCIVSILDIIRVLLDTSIENRMGHTINNVTINGMLFLIGFGVLTIAQVIKDGTILKQENDLTI